MISVTNNLAGTCPIHTDDLQKVVNAAFKSFDGDANRSVSELLGELTSRPEAQNFKFFVTFTSMKVPGDLVTVAGAHWDSNHDGAWTGVVETAEVSGVIVVTWIKA